MTRINWTGLSKATYKFLIFPCLLRATVFGVMIYGISLKYNHPANWATNIRGNGLLTLGEITPAQYYLALSWCSLLMISYLSASIYIIYDKNYQHFKVIDYFSRRAILKKIGIRTFTTAMILLNISLLTIAGVHINEFFIEL